MGNEHLRQHSLHVTDATFDALGERERFVDASDDDQHFTGIHDRANTDGQSRLRDLVHQTKNWIPKTKP